MLQNKEQDSKDISRKDAIKKMGKYAAFAALGTMIMLNPKKAQALSGPPDQGGNWGDSGGFRSNRRNRNKK
tara:strand:+ start:329 stop:541 length:213 start_codon:yes stop_codon:yes gene_type:complete